MTIDNNNRLEGNKGNANTLPTIFQRAKVGNVLSHIKVTVTGATAASVIDITTAAFLADGTVTVEGIELDENEGLPAIGSLTSLRVTASATAPSLGTYGLTDSGGTAIVPPGGAGAAMGIAEISDDGTALTFPNTITAFILQYMPRAAVDMSDGYPPR